ncbi:MAG: small, acid-soluble spore protein, alpha/beta type [Clostridia bacterium]|jgi:small acid-soluble spore protein F (minor alpha/beta-type SASP)|nr:small, acid-soluble spore protein, alpha/beta type [Clostridia bacterium]
MKKEKKKIIYAKDILKLEVAEELGLMPKIKEGGWPELTSEESGRIGGVMTRRMKHLKWI